MCSYAHTSSVASGLVVGEAVYVWQISRDFFVGHVICEPLEWFSVEQLSFYSVCSCVRAGQQELLCLDVDAHTHTHTIAPSLSVIPGSQSQCAIQSANPGSARRTGLS